MRAELREQAEEVDDLVVAPVADVAPRVVRLDGLPVDPLVGDAVGVVAVGGGGADKRGDHVFQEERERAAQRFPVLEDVAPVALVAADRLAVRVAHLDVEVIPGARGVPVAAGEVEREVLREESPEVRPGLWRLQPPAEVGERERRGERAEPVRVGLRHGPVAPADERAEVGPPEAVPVVEDAPAHDVEQDVHAVARRGVGVGGGLLPVRGRHQEPEAAGARVHVLAHARGQGLWRGQRLVQRDHVGGVLLDLGHEVPRPRLARGQREVGVHEVGPAPRPHQGLWRQRPVPAEGLHLLGGQEHVGAVQPGVPDRRGEEGLGGLGAVHGDRAEGEDAQAGRERLVALVGVREHAPRVLERARDAVRHQVLHAVQHADADGPARGVDQLTRADESVGRAQAPRLHKGQPQALVGLLEAEAVAAEAFGEAAADAVDARVAVGERLPQHGSSGAVAVARGLWRDQEVRGAARLPLCAVNPVHGLVGKQRPLRLPTPRREGAQAGGEQPVVVRAHDGHEKRVHAVHVLDAVERHAADLHLAARHRRVVGVERRGADADARRRERLARGARGGLWRGAGGVGATQRRTGCWRGRRCPGRRGWR